MITRPKENSDKSSGSVKTAVARNTHQAVVIADDIRVEVLAVRGNAVKLGIAAPLECAIQAEECWIEMSKPDSWRDFVELYPK